MKDKWKKNTTYYWLQKKVDNVRKPNLKLLFDQ